MAVTFEDVVKAREAIRSSTILTPTVKAVRLSLHMGINLYLKLENLQHTCAFKARGALNKLLTLTDEQKQRGVIACSAGNHAQGVAYHATRLDIPSIIVMPNLTPFNKIKKPRILALKSCSTVTALMNPWARPCAWHRKGMTFIHPFDDEAVVAGQGTLGLEMLEQRPDLDVVVVPIGGGGLIAGVATAVKGLKPEIEVIGAQCEAYDAVKARREGRNFQGAAPRWLKASRFGNLQKTI